MQCNVGGWVDEIALLHRNSPWDSVRKSKGFERDLANAELKIAQARDREAHAAALNAKAWTLAIYGVISDGIAEMAARQAMKIVAESKQDNPAAEASYRDT